MELFHQNFYVVVFVVLNMYHIKIFRILGDGLTADLRIVQMEDIK